MYQVFHTEEHEAPVASPSQALDLAWLKDNLPRFLLREHEAGVQLFDFDILHVWESSKRITLLCQAGWRRQDGTIHQQFYVGYLVREDHLFDEFRSMVKKAKLQPAIGKAVALIPEATMILLAFPNDRKMRLVSEEELTGSLWRHLRASAGNGYLNSTDWQVLNTHLEMLRYVPEKRFTLRCVFELQAQNHHQEVSFIAKQMGEVSKARRLYRNLISLHAALHGNGVTASSSRLRLPKAIALDQERAIVFIEYLPGRSLKQALFEIELQPVMTAVGAMLADFHQIPKSVRKRVTFRNEVAEVREAIQTIAKGIPNLRPRLRAFFRDFKGEQVIDNMPQVLLHGTYRLNHIFIHGEELALLDLDSLRMGNPAYDIANFLSSLYYLEAQARILPAMRRKIARYFLEGYAARSPHPVAVQMVLWFFASLLVNKQAHKYMTHSHEDRKEKVKNMLSLAEAALDQCRRMPRHIRLDNLWKILPESVSPADR